MRVHVSSVSCMLIDDRGNVPKANLWLTNKLLFGLLVPTYDRYATYSTHNLMSKSILCFGLLCFLKHAVN